jgi:hypothetical protein
MFTIRWWINSVEQLRHSGYRDRDDALRRVNALWQIRDQMFTELGIEPGRGLLEFEITSADGDMWDHDAIFREIGSRAVLREPQKVW